MATNSTNFSIPKPATTDVFILSNFNAMIDAIDTNIKVALDAKETPSGAQTKANTAENNAINFAKGFGLGSVAKDITGTNLNSLDTVGFYYGDTLTNGPSGLVYGFVVNIKANSTTRRQFFYSGDSNRIFSRYQLSSVWQPWLEIQTIDPNIGTDIWTGSLQMIGTDIITPTIPITNCPNGWCLQWGDNAGASISYTYMYKWQTLSSYTIHQQHVNTSGTGGLATKQVRVQTSGTQLQGHDFNDDGSNSGRYLRAVKVF